jgi:hypothetical protein
VFRSQALALSAINIVLNLQQITANGKEHAGPIICRTYRRLSWYLDRQVRAGQPAPPSLPTRPLPCGSALAERGLPQAMPVIEGNAGSTPKRAPPRNAYTHFWSQRASPSCSSWSSSPSTSSTCASSSWRMPSKKARVPGSPSSWQMVTARRYRSTAAFSVS